MVTQSDLFEETEDVILAERLVALRVPDIQGIARTSSGYVNHPMVAAQLTSMVGVRNVVEFCVTTLERNSGNEES